MSIKVNNLSHIYAEGTVFEHFALKNVCFEINNSEYIGLIGHTGSGKSTLIQHLNRLLSPTKGNIIIDDTDINSKNILMKDIVKKVGIVFQYPEYQLFEETIYEDISFGPKNLGFNEEDVKQRVKEAMDYVDLDFEEYKDKNPFELSGGQKRRVAIAGVLAMNPEILILDEPASGLDPIGRKEMLENINRLHEKRAMTIILVSHSMDDVAEYADRIMVFSKGELIKFDTPLNVFSDINLLESIGLEAPKAKSLMCALKEKGYDVNTDIYKLEDAKEEILRIWKEK